MNDVNFLPESYDKSRTRRLRVWRQVLLIGLCVAALTGWWLLLQKENRDLEHKRVRLKDQLVLASQQQTELNRLRDEHKVLVHQIQVQRQLAQPVSHTQIVAVLSDLLPESVGITELTMVRNAKTNGPTPAASEQRTAEKSFTSHGKDARLSLEIQAIAPDGATIANLVEAFDKHPMFSSVSMRHSRSVILRGVAGRQFRLELTINLDRRFEFPKAQATTADASG